MKSIKLKLMIFICTLLIFVLAIQGLVLYFIGKNELEKQARESIKLQAIQLAEILKFTSEKNSSIEEKRIIQDRVNLLSKNGIVAVLDSNGFLEYYHDEGLIGQRLTRKDAKTGEDIIDKIMNTKEDYLNYIIKDAFKDEIVSRIAYVKYLPNLNKYVLIERNEREVFEAADKMKHISSLSIIGAIVIAIFSSYFLSSSFTKPILQLKGISERVSKGDLSSNIQIKSKDEIGALGKAFNEMINNLRKVTSESTRVSTSVEETAKILVEMIEQTTTAIEQVSVAVEEIASGASSQAHETEKGVEKGEILNENSKLIQTNAEDMQKYANEMREMSIEGIRVMEDLIEKQKISKDSMERIDNVISILGEQVSKINQFTTTIQDIAEETNLLALNAAIEAARAGEQGKGFAVVAEEIRKLAEESNDAAEEIQGIIDNIYKDTEKAVETVKEAKEISEEQNKAVNDTNSLFRKLENGVKISTEKINEVYDKIKALEIAKNEVINIINNIYKVAENTAASTEEVSASVEEQSASMEEINSYVQDLSKKAEELKGAIEKFTA